MRCTATMAERRPTGVLPGKHDSTDEDCYPVLFVSPEMARRRILQHITSIISSPKGPNDRCGDPTRSSKTRRGSCHGLVSRPHGRDATVQGSLNQQMNRDCRPSFFLVQNMHQAITVIYK